MNENTLQFAWFRDAGDGTFVPEPLAVSLWRSDQLHGVAVSGLLARALEQEMAALVRSDLVPARYRVDLFRPAMTAPTRVETTIVREGPRLVLLDARVLQGEDVVARGSATFLRATQDPDGTAWSSPDRPAPPPTARPAGEHHVPMFASDAPWSQSFGDHQNAGRHTTWQTGVPIVVGEECSPFCAIASIADATSMVTNWGDGGVEHINVDLDLTLARLPVDTSVGLRSTDHVRADGVAVGTAEVFDRLGVIGAASVTSVANTRRTVDLSGPNPGGGAGA